MADLPEVFCWIKLVGQPSGKVIASGTTLQGPGMVIVRYVVANDSHQQAGPLTIVGALYKNGIKIQPGGQSNVVPAQQITLQPDQIWKREFEITFGKSDSGNYKATILGDVGNFVNEEDEQNNKATVTFNIIPIIT